MEFFVTRNILFNKIFRVKHWKGSVCTKNIVLYHHLIKLKTVYKSFFFFLFCTCRRWEDGLILQYMYTCFSTLSQANQNGCFMHEHHLTNQENIRTIILLQQPLQTERLIHFLIMQKIVWLLYLFKKWKRKKKPNQEIYKLKNYFIFVIQCWLFLTGFFFRL